MPAEKIAPTVGRQHSAFLESIRRNGESGIPKVSMDEGLRVLEGAITAKIEERSDRAVIALVAGGSASGKTTISKKLVEHFEGDSLRLSMDNYIRGSMYISKNGINFDHPDSVDWTLLLQHLHQLDSKKGIQMPVYDFKACEREEEPKAVEPKRVIVVEGLYALDERISSLGDVKAFVYVDPKGGIFRRLMRDQERSSWSLKENLAYQLDTVLPMYASDVEPTRLRADLIIENDYNPRKEAKNCGARDVQLKFRESVQPDRLGEIGAEKMASLIQQDEYYKTVNADELIKVRSEYDKESKKSRIIFTYKGPKEGKDFIQRDKLEFEIDGRIRDGISAICDLSEKIAKDREVYSFKGVTFSIDLRVTKTGNDGTATLLGNFVEIKAPNENGKERMRELASVLGLDSAKPLVESYSDF